MLNGFKNYQYLIRDFLDFPLLLEFELFFFLMAFHEFMVQLDKAPNRLIVKGYWVDGMIFV